jgi:multicomponent Na+:H+ antiporter subunit D
VNAAVGAAILVPMLCAAAAFIARRAASAIGAVGALLTSVAAAAVAWNVVADGARRVEVAGYPAPIGIDFMVDGLAATMLLATAAIGLFVTAYATGVLRHEHHDPTSWGIRQSFWPLFLFLWGSLNSLFLSADVFNLYVALEAATLSAVALVLLSSEKRALEAGLRYLLTAFGGSLAYLLGVALIYGQVGTLDLYLIEGDDAALVVALLLMTLGLMVKAGMFPVHFWLPEAHGKAPAMVSPLLSALVVKTGIYLVVRLWFQGLPDASTAVAAQLVGVLAAVAIVWGSIAAFRQEQLKLMIGYSTVAQVGYLFLVLPLAFPTAGIDAAARAEAWYGATSYIVAHGACKAALFMSAGLLKEARGSDEFSRLGGSLRTFPVTVVAFGLAGIALIGVPPVGVAEAKEHLSKAASETGRWWWYVLIYGSTALTAAYIGRALVRLVRSGPAGGAAPMELGIAPQVVVLVLAVAALAVGVGTERMLQLLEIGTPFPKPAG